MKKLFLLSGFLVLTFWAGAQSSLSLTEGEPAFIYSLPKTEFCIQIETEKVTRTPGMFYRYSERYLATTNVITEEKTSYRLKSILVKTRAIADPNRTYTFGQTKNAQNSHITVNSKGILCGLNIPYVKEPENVPTENKLADNSQKTTNLLPLGEEYMMAGSEAKLAEGAAKQIYRIRESRLGLLTADVERLPADGSSFTSMLDGLNKSEKELTELFVGKSATEIQTKTIYLVPTAAAANQVLFRFSALRGLVASDDLSGAPYYITINPEKITTIPADSKAKKEIAALYTIQPALTLITIGDGINTVFSDQYFIPQFGVIVPVSDELFKQPKLKIQIDSQTGRLLSIE